MNNSKETTDETLTAKLEQLAALQKQHGLRGLRIQGKERGGVITTADSIDYALEVTEQIANLMERKGEVPMAA